jgi:hypothetical protein
MIKETRDTNPAGINFPEFLNRGYMTPKRTAEITATVKQQNKSDRNGLLFILMHIALCKTQDRDSENFWHTFSLNKRESSKTPCKDKVDSLCFFTGKLLHCRPSVARDNV